MTAADIARNLRVRKLPSGWVALCPAHNDHNPSLSPNETQDGQILVKCASSAMLCGPPAKGLWKSSGESPPPQQRLVAEYSYTDEPGTSCLSGRFSMPQPVICGHAETAISENPAQIPIEGCHGRGMPAVLGRLPVAGWVRLPSLRKWPGV
jgi:hypothetical protein